MLKYISRHARKNGRQDVEKALHFYHLYHQVMGKHGLSRLYDLTRKIFSSFGMTWVTDVKLADTGKVRAPGNIDVYIAANGFTGTTAKVLLSLDAWAKGIGGEYAAVLPFVLQDLLDEYDDIILRHQDERLRPE